MISEEQLADMLEGLHILSRKRGARFGETAELFSVAETAVALKLHKFDQSRGLALRNWAYSVGDWAITDYLRKIDPTSRRTREAVKRGEEVKGLLQMRQRVGDAVLEFVPIAPTRYDDFDVEKLLQTLTTREARIVRDHYFGGFLQREIATREGVSYSRVSQIMDKALKKLREAYKHAL